MPLRAIRRDVHVLDRIGAIGERPEHRVGIFRIDVLAHRDDVFADIGLQACGAMKCAPDFRARHPSRELQKHHLAQVGQRLVHHHAAHALDRQRVAQIRQITRLVGDALHHARFARRHLAQDRGIDRRPLTRDRGDLHGHVEALERDVAVALAERPFRLKEFGVDQALDDDLGVGRHVQIHGQGFDHADRRAGEPAGHGHLVAIDRQLLWSGEHDHRRATHDDGDRHRLFQLAVYLPVQIAAGAAGPRRHAHAEPIGGLQGGAVGTHVADAGFRVVGDAQGRGEIRRRVVAGRRNRHRQRLQAAVRTAQRVAGDDDLLARRRRDLRWRNWIGDGLHPGVADLLDRPPHADRINTRRRRQRPDCDRHVVAASFGIDDVGE